MTKFCVIAARNDLSHYASQSVASLERQHVDTADVVGPGDRSLIPYSHSISHHWTSNSKQPDHGYATNRSCLFATEKLSRDTPVPLVDQFLSERIQISLNNLRSTAASDGFPSLDAS